MDWSPSATARQFAVELARPRAQMERDGAPDIHRFGWTTGAAARRVVLAGRVGADPLESSDASLQRRLLVLVSVGTLPLTVRSPAAMSASDPQRPHARYESPLWRKQVSRSSFDAYPPLPHRPCHGVSATGVSGGLSSAQARMFSATHSAIA